MARRVLIRPKARRDLKQILVYYLENAGLEVAKRFRAAVTETLEQLAQQPGLGAPRKVRRAEFREVRMWRVTKFEAYLIFYIPRKDGIAVERLIHASQDYRRLLK